MLLIGVALAAQWRSLDSVDERSATALHAFTAREGDELSVRRGEPLRVLALAVEGDEDWSRARREDGRVGLLPRSYLEVRDSPASAAAAEPSGARVDPDGSASAWRRYEHVDYDAEYADFGDSAASSGGGPLLQEEFGADDALGAARRAYNARRALYNNGASGTARKWGVEVELDQFASGEAAARRLDDEPLEHRSGVDGVPFFNLAGGADDAALEARVMELLRQEWLPAQAAGEPPRLAGLDAALAAAATAGRREVILTFANDGYLPRSFRTRALLLLLLAPRRAPSPSGRYADFVLNGFTGEVAA